MCVDRGPCVLPGAAWPGSAPPATGARSSQNFCWCLGRFGFDFSHVQECACLRAGVAWHLFTGRSTADETLWRSETSRRGICFGTTGVGFESQSLSTDDCQRFQPFSPVSQRAGANLVGRRAIGERERVRSNRNGSARPVSSCVSGAGRCRAGVDEEACLRFQFPIRNACERRKGFAQ